MEYRRVILFEAMIEAFKNKPDKPKPRIIIITKGSSDFKSTEIIKELTNEK